MFESENARLNTVDSSRQVPDGLHVRMEPAEHAALKVLFIGNSITKHAPKADIGWEGDWGMAASCRENDYVHQVLKGLRKTYGPVSCCIAQCAEWERRYAEGDAPLLEYYQPARDFAADLIIVRIGENINRDAHARLSCKPYYDRMIRFFAVNPQARVLVTDNFWRIESLDRVFCEVAQERGYMFCTLAGLEEDRRTMALGQFEHEGVCRHPSDFGMRRIAERVMETLREKCEADEQQ